MRASMMWRDRVASRLLANFGFTHIQRSFDGVQYVDSAWWISLFPGLAIVLTVAAINLVGDWLRDALDPRLTG